MSCIDCGQPARGRRCTSCKRTRDRLGDRRWSKRDAQHAYREAQHLRQGAADPETPDDLAKRLRERAEEIETASPAERRCQVTLGGGD